MVPNDETAATRQQAVREFVRELTAEEIMLVTLRDELYEGRWEEMQTDLEERLQGRPYVFKLASRIEDDLARIKKMRAFEEGYQLNLGEFV